MRGGDDDGDIMMISMIMASHAESWCILRVTVASIIVMVGMVMIVIEGWGIPDICHFFYTDKIFGE